MLSNSLSTSEKFARLSEVCPNLTEFAQSLYMLLVAHADDFGRQQGDPFTVRHKVHPTSPRSLSEFAEAIQALDTVGLVRCYTAQGRQVIEIRQFDAHQQGLHKRTRSQFPEFPGSSRKVRKIPGQLKRRELKRTELKRTELKGKDQGALEERAPAPTKALLTLFDTLHQQKLGIRAVISGDKDAALLARLCRTHGPDEVRALIGEFFRSCDPFIGKAGYTVGVFMSQAGKLLAQRTRGDPLAANDEAWGAVLKGAS